MKKNYLIICVFLFLFSCSDELTPDLFNEEVKSEEFILQQRDPNFPLILEQDYIPQENISTRGDVTHKYEFLGHGFKPITLPLIDVTNFSFPILDINKIIQSGYKNPELDIKSSLLINSWQPDISTFTHFDAYAKTESVTKVIKGGFSLSNIPIVGKLFGFGGRKKYTEVFNKLIIDTTKTVYGQMEMIYRDSLHRINIGDAINKDLTGFYSARFKKDLYSTHMTDLLKSYGSFLVSSVETGGILSALYQGTFISKENLEYRSKAMYDSIKATMTVEDITGNLEFVMHKSKGNLNLQVKKFSSINASFRTFGGETSFSKFSPPTNIQDLSTIDFGNWTKSLTNKDLLVISKIGEEGLVPFYDFLYEENLQCQAKKFTTTSISNEKRKLIEPYLYLESYGTNDMRLAILYFVTKYGDYIRLGFSQLPGVSINHSSVQKVFNEMINKEKNFFPNLKVVAKHYYLYIPSQYDDKYITEVVNSVPEKEFNYITDIYQNASPNYEYYKCRENDNIYMISKKNKVGFTFALDYIWTQYGLSKPKVNNLKEITLHELLGYRMFAL